MSSRRLPPGSAPPATPRGEHALPVFPPRGGRDEAVLEASRAVVGLFIRERSSDFSIKQLAEHAGVSERTFYRYFPRKEDAVRPYLEAALAHVLAGVRASDRSRSVQDVLLDVHVEMLGSGRPLDGDVLLSVLSETERMRAVWLQVLTDAEAGYAAALAERLGVPADSLQARLAGAAVVTAIRLSLQSPTAPGRVFADCLSLLGPTLFTADST